MLLLIQLGVCLAFIPTRSQREAGFSRVLICGAAPQLVGPQSALTQGLAPPRCRTFRSSLLHFMAFPSDPLLQLVWVRRWHPVYQPLLPVWSHQETCWGLITSQCPGYWRVCHLLIHAGCSQWLSSLHMQWNDLPEDLLHNFPKNWGKTDRLLVAWILFLTCFKKYFFLLLQTPRGSLAWGHLISVKTFGQRNHISLCK